MQDPWASAARLYVAGYWAGAASGHANSDVYCVASASISGVEADRSDIAADGGKTGVDVAILFTEPL